MEKGKVWNRNMQRQPIELLAPAGSYQTFLAVLQAGADAVYLGGSRFGARAYADNFDEKELLSAIDYAHLHGRKVYLTVNTLLKEEELQRQLYDYLLPYYRQGLDAVIVQDLGAFSLIHREFPELSIHASTQMTVTGCHGAAYLKRLGARRIVTARELSLEEIRKIHETVDIEIESFIHGALCYCYSGQCLLSSMIGGRSGNRGRCAQPCRLPYGVYDADMRQISTKGDFVLSPKDLNTVASIPKLAASGICSFKVEGRMKQAEYAAGVVSVYRSYIDRYLETQSCKVTDRDRQMLLDLGNRSGFTDGYYERQNGREMITFARPNHSKANEKLQETIRARYIDTEIKEKINGILKLKKDFPVTIELSYGEIRLTCQGDTVQKALKQPLSLEKVESSMRRTGNTPFVFHTLQIDMENDVFLPMQSLHQLRRDALDALFAEATGHFHRERSGDGPQQNDGECIASHTVALENLAVAIESKSQLACVLSYDFVNDIYLDSMCYCNLHERTDFLSGVKEDIAAVHDAGKKAYYILPAIFRNRTAEFYEEHFTDLLDAGLDGVLVKNVDAASFAAAYTTDIILDHSLYSWNREAKQVLADLEPLRDTVPLELNRSELFARDNRGSEILLYGNLPLMTSAQCVHANTEGCDRRPALRYLKDRYGKYFPVKNNCAECYNVIYNSTPLMLFGFHEDFIRMGMAGYRISFTTENEKEVRRVMEAYRDIFISGEKRPQDVFAGGSYTNGHYKRGVA